MAAPGRISCLSPSGPRFSPTPVAAFPSTRRRKIPPASAWSLVVEWPVGLFLAFSRDVIRGRKTFVEIRACGFVAGPPRMRLRPHPETKVLSRYPKPAAYF